MIVPTAETIVQPVPVAPTEAHTCEAHTWTLRGVEFEDATTIRCFECLTCTAVRYE